jgi:hypothetical protein
LNPCVDLPEEESDLTSRSPGDFLAKGPSRIEEATDPNTDSPAEIGRQVSFYRQLLSFEREVLEHMRRLASDRPGELREAVERSNIEPMHALIEQFEQRLDFWQERERSLDSE